MKKGFTLAEVLITLVIIGVVAALTIPTLIKANKRTEVEAALKKSYSVFVNVIKLSELDNGNFSSWDFTGKDAAVIFSTYIEPYIKTSKVCNTANPCPAFANKNPNGEVHWDGSGNMTNGAYLADGSFIAVEPIANPNLLWYVDINGLKGPNVTGKDGFWFQATPEGKLVTPSYDNLAAAKPLCDSTTPYAHDILFCTALIMGNGWKIPHDYKWL